MNDMFNGDNNMKIAQAYLDRIEDHRKPLPKGKLNVRWSQSNGTYLVYAGRWALYGPSGLSEDEALESVKDYYHIEA